MALAHRYSSHLIANVPGSEVAAASSKEANRKQFEDRGIAFRVVNYEDPQSLESAFEDVENLLFVAPILSTSRNVASNTRALWMQRRR